MNRNQLWPSNILKVVLSTVKNGVACLGPAVGMVQSCAVKMHRLGPVHLLLTPRWFSWPVLRLPPSPDSACHPSSTSVQFNTDIQGMKAKAGWREGEEETGRNVLGWTPRSKDEGPQMRKTMPSETMTWLSSCILLSAAWISVEEKGSSLSRLTDSVRRLMPTDCAWASRNTSKRAALKAFNLPRMGERGWRRKLPQRCQSPWASVYPTETTPDGHPAPELRPQS